MSFWRFHQCETVYHKWKNWNRLVGFNQVNGLSFTPAENFLINSLSFPIADTWQFWRVKSKTFLGCIVVYSKSLKIYSNCKYHTELNGRQKFWILEHIPQYSSVNQLLQLDKNNFPKELSPHNCVNSGVMRRNPEKGIRRIQNLLSLISLLNKTSHVWFCSNCMNLEKKTPDPREQDNIYDNWTLNVQELEKQLCS